MEPPRDFSVEFGSQWKRWAKQRSEPELQEIAARLGELRKSFGKPHQHGGLGVRRLENNAFEFRISRALRVIFFYNKPNVLKLMMVGNHDDVRTWIRENL
jgi:hypothetical protein